MSEWFYTQRGTQPVLYYIVPLRGPRGSVQGAIELVRLAAGVEETERALELERQVRHAQTVAVAGRLATALAHEIGTPLRSIASAG